MRHSPRTSSIIAATKDAKLHIDTCKAIRALGHKSDDLTDEEIKREAAKGKTDPGEIAADAIARKPPRKAGNEDL